MMGRNRSLILEPSLVLDAAPPFQPLLPLPGLTPVPARLGRTGRRRRAATTDGVAAAALAPVSPAAPLPAVAASLAAAPPSTAPLPCAWDATEIAAARRVYLALASRWELSGTEALVLLGEPSAGEADRGERICLLVRVTRLLQLVHAEPERARAVLREPHPALEGTAPLALMLAEGCAGMARVRDWLVTLAICSGSSR